ncbi:transposase [Actinomadura viridis]|uniref:transposase n=1 Tax=Actinomadura viridis TaxID=58110 RepID=UPI0036ABEF2C
MPPLRTETAPGRAGPGQRDRHTSYLLGVSTQRVDKLVEQMGTKGISESQVSGMSEALDARVATFP